MYSSSQMLMVHPNVGAQGLRFKSATWSTLEFHNLFEMFQFIQSMNVSIVYHFIYFWGILTAINYFYASIGVI